MVMFQFAMLVITTMDLYGTTLQVPQIAHLLD